MSKQVANTPNQISSSGGEDSILTPASTPSSTSQKGQLTQLKDLKKVDMDEQGNQQPEAEVREHEERPSPEAGEEGGDEAVKPSPSKKKKHEGRCKKRNHKKLDQVKKSRSKKSRIEDSDSDSDSEDSSSESEASDDSVVEEALKKKGKKKAVPSKAKPGKKTKKDRRKGKKQVEESDSESTTESEATGSESEDDEASDEPDIELKRKQLELQLAKLNRAGEKSKPKGQRPKRKSSKRKSSKSKFTAEYKRVDQLWDSTIHNFKLKESAEDDDSEFAEYAFLVRRTFDWENKYKDTVIDVKSKQLRAALAEVMKDCKSVSLEAEEPVIDPNTLFLYLEELRAYCKSLKSKIRAEKKRKVTKNLSQQRALLRSLVDYIDEDYADTKKTLYPLLKNGNITFDLLWALFHPNEVAVTSCYGSWDEPRCFKVEYTNKCASMTRGEWYCIEGKYLEYDGKSFGFGDFEVDVEKFQGPRKITSLATYPLKYYPTQEKVKKQILQRGERLVNLEGMHYKFHKGMAFQKKKKQVLKININGRVMLDPATFRRVNPNYPISYIKPKEDDDLFSICGSSDDDSDEDGCCCCGSDSENEDPVGGNNELERKEKKSSDNRPKYKYKWGENERGQTTLLAIEVDEDGDPILPQRVDGIVQNGDLRQRSFTEEELLLTSPVILGFAFGEKLWLEFTISGVHEITYNEEAFNSLVLPPNQKSIVRALVESHKCQGARTIDDVVQGKGKGLVAVLHGPPGTGKTLTAEGISELLKCPLYCVSAGELGTDPGRLEHGLQTILDIAHSWGAVLLLDEADVFLEKREVHDIHRNALVSIFLRLLEYFQGILFLTTNRVETFDDAFQSRIHVALRYGELTHKAKKAVWKMFLDLVRKVEGMEVDEFTDRDLDVLSRNQLNGRQIKNLVRTAQALALNEKQKLTMEHIKRVADVAESFDRDLKGGTGYIDAMRSYT
jgi:hypothetical protein